MKVTFKVETSNFIDAGIVEEALKKLGFKYEADIRKCTRKAPAGGKLRRKRITKLELGTVVSAIQHHPDWGDSAIAKYVGVSGATVSRIRNKTHALMIGSRP